MYCRDVLARGSAIRTSMLKRSASTIYDEDLLPENLGVETEAEKQMKVMLEKQLNKKISLREQFAQHRTFTSPSTYNSLTELVKGTCSLDKFQEIEKNEEIHQELQRCGLSEEQIKDYLAFKSGKMKQNSLVDPAIWNENMQQIEQQIKAHNEELTKPQGFSNVKKLTRHEMEIETTLYAGCSDKNKLSALIAVAEDSCSTEVNDAFDYVKTLSQKLLEKCKRKKLRGSKNSAQSSTSIENNCEGKNIQYDANIHHVIVPLEENEVKEKCLTVDEIKLLPKFKNYEMGSPNKVLYLKNLHPKVTVNELRSIFGCFEEENNSAIDYKICSGRMKGQAFIHFVDSKIAEKALAYANGYVLREKPIIIEFGRKP